MSLSKPLPCPFCGGPATVQPWKRVKAPGRSSSGQLVSCLNEECAVTPRVAGLTKAEAIKRWNERNPKYPVPDVPAMNKVG